MTEEEASASGARAGRHRARGTGTGGGECCRQRPGALHWGSSQQASGKIVFDGEQVFDFS